jgi:hypothetical protein
VGKEDQLGDPGDDGCVYSLPVYYQDLKQSFQTADQELLQGSDPDKMQNNTESYMYPKRSFIVHGGSYKVFF